MFTPTKGHTSPGLARRSMRPLVLGALCAAFVAAAPATARAQTVDDTDTVEDMAKFTFDSSRSEGLVPAPERELNDASNTTLKHGARRVAIQVDYADLKKKARLGERSGR